MCKNHFGLNGTALFFLKVLMFDSGSEYLGHHVDFSQLKNRAADDTNASVPVPVGDSNGIYKILYTLDTHILIYMIYISGPCVSITHECYFTVVDLDLLTCDIVDAWATCS